MQPAILSAISPNSPPKNDVSGTVSNPLDNDRRNSGVWVPEPPFYGDGQIVVVGFDTEYVPRGDHNVVLSYQLAADDLSGHRWKYVETVKPGRRFRVASLVGAALDIGFDQGHLHDWPDIVYLVGHFTLADLPGFSDFKDAKYEFDSIRRTFVSIQQPAIFTLYDKHRHPHRVRVILRDTLLLAPAGKQSLADLGDLVGLPKIDLEEDQIAHMDVLLRDNRELFLEYAERDPEICVKYAVQIMDLNHDIVGKRQLPPTLSGIGVDQLFNIWKATGLDHNAVLGTEMVEDRKWSSAYGRSIKCRRDVPIQARQLYESFASECYHGGRNEQFFFGAGNESVWTDYDLCGAYTTAMLMIGVPDWNHLHPTHDSDAFQPDVMGFARVQFEFPVGTRFPCLPVRTPYGLVFPLTGESCCCSPEIYLAMKMGAKLRVLDGIILPSSFRARPFEMFVIECNKRRKSYQKKSLPELLWKEIGNSLYGKLAQGLMMKRCFDARSGAYRPLPPSRITNPFFAAYITSFIRAVLGEILSRLRSDVEVCNATTDGFLTTASHEDIRVATQGPLCRHFAQARLRVCGDETILEAKHRIAQPLGWRTRGQATLKAIPEEAIVLAKAGLKPPKKIRSKADQNEWTVDLFRERTSDSRLEIELLRCLPEIHQKGGDLGRKTTTRRVSMEYDWKRRPINPAMKPINEIPHLYFDTCPWNSVDDFLRCRETWEAYRKRGDGVLKTTAELAAFGEYQLLTRGPLRVPRKNAGVALAKRMFLRAYVRSAWGLDATVMSYSELARWLSHGGFPTKKDDVENARRPASKLIEGVVAGPVADRLIAYLKTGFPNFEGHRLISSTHERSRS